MAEATGLRNVALPYPVYGVPFGVTFGILDADGDLVTGATGLDSEVSKNGDTFADCTNEATEIATSSGVYYLLLTATEMTADVVTVIVKTSSSGAKTTTITLYPRKLVTLATGTSQGGAAGYITLAANTVSYDDQFNGCLCVATIDSVVEARILQDCTASNQQCTVTPSWNTTPDSDDTYVIYLPEGMQIPTANTTRVSGTSQTARDIGASVLLSSGTGAGQIDFTSGVVKANVTQYGGSNGTFASGRPEVNMTHIAGSSVNTSTAQLGVNVVNFGGSPGAFSSGIPSVNLTHYLGTSLISTTIPVDVIAIDGQTANASAAVNFEAYVGSAGAYLSPANIADGVWDEAQSGHVSAGTFGYFLDAQVSAAGGGGGASAADIWDYATASATTVGSMGKLIVDNLNATITSRLADADYTAPDNAGIGNIYAIVNDGSYGNAAIATLVSSVSNLIGTPSVTVSDDIASLNTLIQDVPTNAEFSAAFPTNFAAMGINVSGHVSRVTLADTITTYTGNTPQTGDAYAIVNNGTYGNSAIKTAVDALQPASDVASSFNQTYGTVISGTYSNTATDDNSRHVLAPQAVNGLDADYTFTIPTENKPTRVTINGYFNGTAQYAEVYAYNYDTAAYVQLSNSTTRMATRSSDTNYSYELSRDYAEDGVGTVKIRFVSPSTNTGHRLHLDRILVYSLTEAVTEAGITAANVWEYAGSRQLSSDGLDLVSTTAPTGVASNFREMLVQVWRRFFKKTEYNNAANTIKTYADDGTTVVTTQTATSASGVETQGPAT